MTSWLTIRNLLSSLRSAGWQRPRCLRMWLPQQMVVKVLGKGPVPTYKPPYVPVGPVVGGEVIEAPGCLP